MDALPACFVGEPIEVTFDQSPLVAKKPGCPDGFHWREQFFRVRQMLGEWQDYRRRGRMARNMSPPHAATAARRGSWGVGRFYFRVLTDADRVFDLYYDRAPKDAADRAGCWFLFRELTPPKTGPEP
jgi:hypothetical protein